jgi:hypothetical protein
MTPTRKLQSTPSNPWSGPNGSSPWKHDIHCIFSLPMLNTNINRIFSSHIFIKVIIQPVRHSYIHIFTQPYTHTFAHPYIHTSILHVSHLRISMYSYLHISIHSYIHIFIYSYIHIFIYLYIHPFSHSSILAFSSSPGQPFRPGSFHQHSKISNHTKFVHFQKQHPFTAFYNPSLTLRLHSLNS